MKNQARWHIVQALYQCEIAHTALDDLLNHYQKETELAADSAYAHFADTIRYVLTHQEMLDHQIAAYLSARWSLDRLDKVLLALLRAGAAEKNLHPAKNELAAMVADYVRIAHRLLEKRTAATAHAILDKLAHA